MFYEFSQNNSGGVFDQDLKRGISHYVIIEADNANDATERAERIGLYFNGCDSGMDCHCCGDRWDAPWEDKEGTPTPTHYGKPIEDYTDDWGMIWKSADHLFVHYKDGTIKDYKQVATGGKSSFVLKSTTQKEMPKKKTAKKKTKTLAKKATPKVVSKKAAKKAPVKKTASKKK